MTPEQLTEIELQQHEKHLEDYPDAMPTYETLVRYISNIRALLEERKELLNVDSQRDRKYHEDGETIDDLKTQLEQVKEMNNKAYRHNVDANITIGNHLRLIESLQLELQQTREELEQFREDLPGWKIENMTLRDELEQVKAELSAKDFFR